MNISMFKVICVTQMSAAEDFPKQLEKICAAGIDRVILREKHLTENDYEILAGKVIKICTSYQTVSSLSGRQLLSFSIPLPIFLL